MRGGWMRSGKQERGSDAQLFGGRLIFLVQGAHPPPPLPLLYMLGY